MYQGAGGAFLILLAVNIALIPAFVFSPSIIAYWRRDRCIALITALNVAYFLLRNIYKAPEVYYHTWDFIADAIWRGLLVWAVLPNPKMRTCFWISYAVAIVVYIGWMFETLSHGLAVPTGDLYGAVVAVATAPCIYLVATWWRTRDADLQHDVMT
jgi:hypothetical protein